MCGSFAVLRVAAVAEPLRVVQRGERGDDLSVRARCLSGERCAVLRDAPPVVDAVDPRADVRRTLGGESEELLELRRATR